MNKKRIDKLYQSDLDSISDYKSYLNDLNILENYNFQNHIDRFIYDTFYDYAKILPLNYGIFNPEKFNKHTFYRVRLQRDIGKKEDLSLIQTYSYPPTSVLRNNGRANLKYKSVFYCSDKPLTSLIESKPKNGDEGFISVWKPKASRPVKIGICLPRNLSSENDWHLMAKDYFDNYINDFPKEQLNHFIKLFDFIANRFVTEKDPYYLTSMISNEHLYNNEPDLWRDFIIYPSVLSKTLYCNMAFHPNSINDTLNFEKALKFKVIDIKRKLIKIEKVGYFEKTKMLWRKQTKEENELFNIK